MRPDAGGCGARVTRGEGDGFFGLDDVRLGSVRDDGDEGRGAGDSLFGGDGDGVEAGGCWADGGDAEEGGCLTWHRAAVFVPLVGEWGRSDGEGEEIEPGAGAKNLMCWRKGDDGQADWGVDACAGAGDGEEGMGWIVALDGEAADLGARFGGCKIGCENGLALGWQKGVGTRSADLPVAQGLEACD